MIVSMQENASEEQINAVKRSWPVSDPPLMWT
jgi:hypothetical protein